MRRGRIPLLGGFFSTLMAAALVFGAQSFLREADAPRAMFGEGATATRNTLELTDAELESLGQKLDRKVEVRRYPYLEAHNAQGLVGLIFMFDVIGQSQPITFAVGVTPDGGLKDVQVMMYREPQGGEIQEKRFRKQFAGKRLSDPIALGKDIDAISGATISSRSASYAARKALALFEVLRSRSGTTSKP